MLRYSSLQCADIYCEVNLIVIGFKLRLKRYYDTFVLGYSSGFLHHIPCVNCQIKICKSIKLI